MIAATPALKQSPAGQSETHPPDLQSLVIPLDGQWSFTLANKISAAAIKESPAELDSTSWQKIHFPHTWQTSEETAEFQGTAYYRTYFPAPAVWADQTVRIEFQAVTHTATVWVNEKLIGSHEHKGYTAFTFDISGAIKFGALNALTVKVDNPFNTRMLPREKSFDWTPGGGIIRPVSLLVTGPTYIERIVAGAEPILDDSQTDLKAGLAQTRLRLRAIARNNGKATCKARVSFTVSEDGVQRPAFPEKVSPIKTIAPGAAETLEAPPVGERMSLWHFDRPKLYRVRAELECDGKAVHTLTGTFGVRGLEVRGTGFYLNGERVRLMGVERMAGSHPDYGMAEPSSWIDHDHNDLKELNCVFTRVHWPQDQRVLDYCDRNGILIQEEVPAWGADTFRGMAEELSPAILENGIEQLREMIERDRNHPSIFAWGLCNEVNGQNPPAQRFIRRMAEEARKLDPTRLLTYASNSLQQTPERDAAGELDFISWNEYYESWYGGDVDSVRRNLEAIHRAFPGKPVVVSEYGYCECAPDRTGGDPRRIEVLRNHTNVFREFDFVAGAIFFDYNDYRTHMGDKGYFALRQRVHGVVDLYGNRKPSFEALREESSALAELQVSINGRWITVSITTRTSLPAYAIEGYSMRAIVYGFGDLPVEQHSVDLPRRLPGEGVIQEIAFEEKNPRRIRVDILRPTGFSAGTVWWKA